MTWVSLVCLLALSSSALGHYGSAFRSRTFGDQILPKTVGYGQQDTTVLDQGFDKQPIGQVGYGQKQQGIDFSTVFGGGNKDLTGGFGGVNKDLTGGFGDSVPTDTSSQQGFGQQPFPTGYGQKQGLNLQNIVQGDQGYGVPSYGQRLPQLDMTPRGYGDRRQFFDQQQVQQPILTQADTICQGQRPETVIPLQNTRKFVVCLDDSKGVEQHCPKGLHYHVETRRCERRLGQVESPCASQPCLNGGQCIVTDVSSYQCQCPGGFDGKTCELDARVCQQQNPCGQSPDSRCQSFRLGAALQHVCLCQDEKAYGLTCQQAQPNPCKHVDGPQTLGFSDKGFIMCDGERMFVESCPGGTVWDDLNKACVWPDMQGIVSGVPPQQDQSIIQGYGKETYGQIQRPQQFDIRPPSFVHRPRFEQKTISAYGERPRVAFDLPMMKTPSYGTQFRPQIERPQLDQTSYGSESRPQLDQTSYGTQSRPQLDMTDKSTYGTEDRRQFDQTVNTFPQQKQPFNTFEQIQTSPYDTQPQIQPRPVTWQQPIKLDLPKVLPSTTY